MTDIERVPIWSTDSQIRSAIIFILLSISFFMVGSLIAKKYTSSAIAQVPAVKDIPSGVQPTAKPSANARTQFSSYASDLGINIAKFEQCLDSTAVGAKVDADVALASKVGITGTPSFFVNKISIIGAQPVNIFTTAIDTALNGKSPTPDANGGITLTDEQWAEVLKDPVFELGQKNARVTLVEFTDYQCPFCQRAFQQTWPTIKKDYIDSGKIHYVIRDMPLPFHNNAKLAAIAARCAGEQGKYLEMHDQLFTNQSIWQ